jgi:hypothetical protein
METKLFSIRMTDGRTLFTTYENFVSLYKIMRIPSEFATQYDHSRESIYDQLQYFLDEAKRKIEETENACGFIIKETPKENYTDALELINFCQSSGHWNDKEKLIDALIKNPKYRKAIKVQLTQIPASGTGDTEQNQARCERWLALHTKEKMTWEKIARSEYPQIEADCWIKKKAEYMRSTANRYNRKKTKRNKNGTKRNF